MTSSMLSAFNPLFKGKHKDADPEAPADAGNELTVASGEADASKNTTAQSTMSPERRKVLEGVRICLLVLCLTLAAVMITCTVKMLYEMPYEPIFWLYMFSMILYWILSFTLIGLSMKVYLLRNEETGVKACSKESLLREIKRIEFWVFLASLLATFICMFLLLRFALPEVFFPSGDLKYKRLGAVTADTASVWIRDPTLGENAQIFVEYRLNGTDDPFQLSTDSANLTNDNDYSGFIRLTGLSPSTAYEFRFQQVPDETLSFRTHPVPGTPSKFSFYFGSCFLHNFPNLNEAPGFGYVLDNLQPDLFAFLGDFIYSDVPFFRDDTVGTYKSLYRQSLRNTHVRRAFRALPNYHMWDDHEVQNDFPDLRPSNIKTAGRASFDNAIGMAWNTYLGGGNPTTFPGKTYFNFDYGDSSFFFVDTRVQRVSNKLPDSPTKTILGTEQKNAFKNWLLDKNTTSKFKFVMSPLALTHDFPSVIDSWGGYKTERDEIFEFIRENAIEGVVFFTGDSHFAYALELGGAPGGIRGGLYEFSASPISAFDFSLGGFLTDPTFVPEEKREDRLMFEYTGRLGAMSLLGLTRVDTTKPVPEISVEFYDGTTHIFTANLTLEMLRPWAAT